MQKNKSLKTLEPFKECNAENIRKIAKILRVKINETDKLEKIVKILAIQHDIDSLKYAEPEVRPYAIKVWRNEIKKLLREIKER